MANLNNGTTSYPGGLDTSPDLTDGPAGDEIVSAHQDGRGAAIVAIETELGLNPSGTVADVVTRLNASQNTDGTLLSGTIVAGSGAAVAYSGGVFTIGWSPDGPNYVQNFGIELTPNSPVANAMRVRLVQRSGATPTSASPVRVAFRVATLSGAAPLGTYVVREISADTQLQLSSGSTLAGINNEHIRCYVWGIDNGGTVEAGVSRDARFPEGDLHDTSAEGGAGGADANNLLYSTSARSNVPIRCLGYFEVQNTTAGNWAANPLRVQLMGPGIKRTGDTVQQVSTFTTALLTGTTITPFDNSKPLSNEGNLVFTLPASITSAANPIMIHANGLYYAPAGGGENVTQAIFGSNATTTAIAASSNFHSAASTAHLDTIYYGTTTAGSVTYALRAGSSAAGTFNVNGSAGTQLFNGAGFTSFRLTELMA